MTRYLASAEEFSFDSWTITAVKDHILPSDGPQRKDFESELNLPHVPDMIFAKNILRFVNSCGNGIEFNALDALKRVDATHDLIHVANSKSWKAARADCEFIENVVHPFDWTFSTDYSGNLLGNVKVEDTTERIDVERLKVRDKIDFYTDLPLFEDELHDCGCSMLSVKTRVMPNYFFVLMRFYLRVDDVLVRVNDTRLFHETGTDFILREYTHKESKSSELHMAPSVIIDPNAIAEHLNVVSEKFEKLHFASS